MTYDEFNQFCESLTATTHVVQWGGAHVWKVGGKVFAIGGWGEDEQPGFIFKTSEPDFYFLQDEPDYRPAPYMASRGLKWIQQTTGSVEKDEELKAFIKNSYRMVSLGLTRKKQKELGLNQD